MGVYYKIINLDRREYLSPSTFGQTLKMQEFTEEPAGVLEGLALLLAEDHDQGVLGRWARDRVIFASSQGPADADDLNLYRRATRDPEYTNVGPQVVRYMAECGGRITTRRLVERAREHEWATALRDALEPTGLLDAPLEEDEPIRFVASPAVD